MSFCDSDENVKALKSDLMIRWMEREWHPQFESVELLNAWLDESCTHAQALNRLEPDFDFGNGFRFEGYQRYEGDCDVVTRTEQFDQLGRVSYQTGAFVYAFDNPETGEHVDILVISTLWSDNGWYWVTLGAVPREFLPVFAKFAEECSRLAYAMEPSDKVIVVGGNINTFEAKTDWDEVVLPPDLKRDIQQDVEAFFTKGVGVYTRLNLKPFRKLLLAGVPGTGKTMICSALAKWALERDYLVIYVSSARKQRQDDEFGSSFNKIQNALSIASSSSLPSLIILEELDAYLHDEEKALILNVLDGSEAALNDKGTLLVATTNYPEAIDERVLKRPGRLDRIFIVPEARREEDAEKMLKQYLGEMWNDSHTALVPKLIGYPGAFIREVAVYALTQVAYDDLSELSYEILDSSFKKLKDQIEARDDFLKHRPVGFSSNNGVHR